MFNNFSQFQSFPTPSSYQQISGQMNQMQGVVYPQQNYQNSQSFSQNTNITFVNGMEGAKAFQLSPNSNVLLMDSDNSKFYVKSTDNLGVPKISSYSFSEDTNLPSNSLIPENIGELGLVTTEEFSKVSEKVSEIESKIYDFMSKFGDLVQ